MAEENKSGNENDTPLTFDEILEDKEYQSEFDKRVSKALETAKTKWQATADAATTKAVNEAKAALEADHATKTSELETALTKSMIQTELVKSKARDVDVILPLIDQTKITRTDKGLEGLAEQLTELKTGKSYLFEAETEPEKKSKTGLSHDNGNDAGDDDAIRMIMGLPPKKG